MSTPRITSTLIPAIQRSVRKHKHEEPRQCAFTEPGNPTAAGLRPVRAGAQGEDFQKTIMNIFKGLKGDMNESLNEVFANTKK